MISTNHRLIIGDAGNLDQLRDESVDLVVTSPPYPLIGMWDELFGLLNPEIKKALAGSEGRRAFELMHRELDRVWSEVSRVLCRGGIACLNIGDATRTVDGLFQLFSNHSRVLQFFLQNEFVALPGIIWRKQTNAPNKFMGSGALPPGAYVTLEHEHILILRKGGKKEFEADRGRRIRQESAYFWEERNLWFSDVWADLKGVGQDLNESGIRGRSAAYPYELAHRLINMFSLQGDLVLDPFVGTGTTMLAAMGNARNSIGVEIESGFKDIIARQCGNIVDFSNDLINKRLQSHLEFTKTRIKDGREIKYINECYKFPVVTRQEVRLQLHMLESIQQNSALDYTVFYRKGAAGDC